MRNAPEMSLALRWLQKNLVSSANVEALVWSTGGLGCVFRAASLCLHSIGRISLRLDQPLDGGGSFADHVFTVGGTMCNAVTDVIVQ